MDGYDAQGNRVYDKVEGQTCHQCRQKTMGKRTSCSQCQSLSVRPRPCLLSCITSLDHFAPLLSAVVILKSHMHMPSSVQCKKAAWPAVQRISQHPPAPIQCRGCSAATACSCGTARTWTRRTQSPTGRARTAATRCCATAASTGPAAAGPQLAPSTARPSPWVRLRCRR